MAYVYVFDFGDMVKVGYTGCVQTRLNQIQYEIKTKAIRKFSVVGDKDLEQMVHNELKSYRQFGEWYSCSFDIAKDAVIRLSNSYIQSEANEAKAERAFTVRIYRESIQKLDCIAKANDRSRNSEINRAIKQYIAEYERENGKITPEDLREFEEQ